MKHLIGHTWSVAGVVLITVAAAGIASAASTAAGPVAHAVQPASPVNRAAIVERLRTELATLLKKEPRSVPIDRSVTALGADDLDVVEWTMAAEEAFRVDIAEDQVFDPATKSPRKELTITSMAAIVEKARRSPGRSR